MLDPERGSEGYEPLGDERGQMVDVFLIHHYVHHRGEQGEEEVVVS